jgi:hypothetical protein
MNNILGNFDSGVNSILNEYVRKPTIIRGLVHLLLILYATRMAPTPPKAILRLFENAYFKLFTFSLVIWTAQFSPSTSILIALAFMVTVNYTTTGKLWEMMDNIGAMEQEPASEEKAMEAIKALAEAAASGEAASPSVVAPVANIAASASTTQVGVNAIKALAEQAVTEEAGTQENISKAATIAMESIKPLTTMVPSTEMVPSTTIVPSTEMMATKTQCMQAVQALATAAASEVSIPVEDVAKVAQIALSGATTMEGSDAIKSLADQAITPEAGVPEKVNAAVQVAINSIKTMPINASDADMVPELAVSMVEQQSGCYPMRQYDMKKVSPRTNSDFSFEDYQTFVSSPQ